MPMSFKYIGGILTVRILRRLTAVFRKEWEKTKAFDAAGAFRYRSGDRKRRGLLCDLAYIGLQKAWLCLTIRTKGIPRGAMAGVIFSPSLRNVPILDLLRHLQPITSLQEFHGGSIQGVCKALWVLTNVDNIWMYMATFIVWALPERRGQPVST